MGTDLEKIPLCQETVNPQAQICPSDFDLLKVLGKGGYGKVSVSLEIVSKVLLWLVVDDVMHGVIGS